jgi:hypothetical protein
MKFGEETGEWIEGCFKELEVGNIYNYWPLLYESIFEMDSLVYFSFPFGMSSSNVTYYSSSVWRVGISRKL